MTNETVADDTKKCAFEGCDKRVIAFGYCDGHYRQIKKGKSLSNLVFHRPKRTLPIIKFDEVECLMLGLEGKCHAFSGTKDSKGYGVVRFNEKFVKVHRYVYERDVGPIPEGLMIDHQCRNRACCNVKHLRVVTPAVNSTENVVGIGWQVSAAKTHCPQGHPYDAENTYMPPSGGRKCRKCIKKQSLARRKH